MKAYVNINKRKLSITEQKQNFQHESGKLYASLGGPLYQ